MCPTMAPTLSRFGDARRAVEVLGERLEVQSMPASSASSDMPSTFSSVRTIVDRGRSGRVGAMPKPQLPMTTVVTPCHDDGVRSGSQRTWAS